MKKDLTNVKGFIYKITSPNNKIYIGQTLNWYKRKSDYKYKKFKQQIKLWNNCSFYNWSPEDTFEIIEECLCGYKKEFLNEREKFWISFYNSFKNGLNCNEGGHGNLGCEFSLESREKMSKSKMGIKHDSERNKRKSERMKGYTHSEKSKLKMSESKLANMSELIKEKIRIGLKGNVNGIGNKGNSKKIICITNGLIYNSIKEATVSLGLQSSNIINVCKNKTTHTGGYKFKYYE
jgi:group I intron endonuclease